MIIHQYDHVMHGPTGRAAFAMRDEEVGRVHPVVWVAWDDAASCPQFVATEDLVLVSHGCRGEQVIYNPRHPEWHGHLMAELQAL